MPSNTPLSSAQHPDLLAAIVAKLTAGKPDRAEELNSMLGSLPDMQRGEIMQRIFKHSSDTDLNTLAAGATPSTGPARFKIHRAAEALLPQPPAEWVIETLFSRGTVSLVVGDPGSKKTYSTLDLGICVALGKPWLSFATHKCPVLLVDEESGERRINMRLGNIMRAHSANEETEFHYVTLSQLNLTLSADVSALEALVLETQAGLVIVDTMADIMPGADENKVQDVQPVFMALRRVADRANCTLVLIHHSNKMGGYRGSSALLGAIDIMLKVESKPGSDEIHFKLEKNRDGEVFDFKALANFLPGQFYLSGGEVQPRQKPTLKLPKAKTYVLKFLRDRGRSFVKDICANADVCSANSARNATYDLADEGLVQRVDAGGPGKSAEYDLTEKGRELIGPADA